MNALEANLIDLFQKKIYPVRILFDTHITAIEHLEKEVEHYILPGFVDAHVHIESSMLIPSEFARQAVQHGCVATVSDPHEIANVSGVKGIGFMFKSSLETPLHVHLMIPS